MDSLEKYELVVGLEIHAQLSTRSKMYSEDPADYGASPNSQVSVVSLGHPGTLPVVNQDAVEYAVRMGLATGCAINPYNEFARKNYFYADLPKGYQISQDKTPICTGGSLTVETAEGRRTIRIQRIHMEEDSGKSIHDLDPFFTLVDLNRAGVPLIEIVSEPDIRSGDEAYAYINEIRKLVRYLNICDGNMEEGSLRCDANISVRLRGSAVFGTKVEVKNMNSMRNVKRAIEAEFVRQVEAIENGERLEQQTRGFDPGTGKTFVQRSKELAHDYRYFPEPDLPPVILDRAWLNTVQKSMPKLPEQLLQEYIGMGLSDYDSRVLLEEKEVAFYFNELIQHTKNVKAAANWMLGPVKNFLNEQGIGILQFPLPPLDIAGLIALIDEGKTNFSVASSKLFPAMTARPGKSAAQWAEELNLLQNSDEEFIRSLAQEVLAAYPAKVEEYRSGKKGLLGLFVGELMKKSAGKADPKLASQIIQQYLENQ